MVAMTRGGMPGWATSKLRSPETRLWRINAARADPPIHK
jgi:hypothetical protein